MITLSATDSLSGVAGTAAAITYTLFGDRLTTTDNFERLTQGQLPSSVGTIYPATASTQTLIKSIHLANTTGSPVTGVRLYSNGTAAGNQIVNLTIPANGTAEYGSSGWKVYDSTGNLLTTASFVANSVGNATLSQMPAHTYKGNNTASTANAIDVTSTQLTADLNLVTTSLQGMMSAADKLKVNNLWYDATNYGFVGDDSTDNLAAFNALLPLLPFGATVFFPTGTYRVSGELNINVDKRISFRGSSRYTTFIKTTSATANIFNVSVAGFYNTFEDLGFQTTVAKTAGACIAITAGNNAGTGIYRCWFTGRHFYGINANGNTSGNLSVWSDLDMSGDGILGWGANGRGIIINGATINVQIHNSTINLSTITAGTAVMEINQAGSVQVTGCDFIQGTNVILINGTAGSGAQAVYFTNCFFDQPAGDVVQVIGTTTSNRIKFTQCGIAPIGNNNAVTIAGTGAGGVGTATALPAGLSLIDCDIYNQGGTGTGAGIRVAGCQDINIQNCRITGFNGSGGAGIRIIPSASNQTKARITGNIFGPNSNLTVTNATHIEIQAGSSGLGALSIADNQMEGASSAPFTDASAAVLGVLKRISQNSGLMAGQGTQQLLSSGGAAVIAGRGAVTSGTANTFLFTVRVPANSVQVGQKFRVRVESQTSNTGVPTFNVHLGVNGTIGGDTVNCAIVLAAQSANGYQQTEVMVEVVALGPTATVVAHGRSDGSVATGTAQTAAAETALNVPTTAAWFITFAAACGTIGTITVRNASVEAL